ncbi:MAG: beta strand repeat-containing protein [Dehalococcoidia bacterium]
MTMMALTRKRHRAFHLWALALALLLVGALAIGLRGDRASAIAEGDVQFTVSQSPAGGSMVQVGSTASFVVTPTVTNAPFNIPLYIEFLTPSGLVYTGSNAPGGITCALIPATDDVRCDYGNVVAGPIVPITLNFTVSNSVATAASQFQARAGAADGGPDLASDGDDSFANAGTLTVFSPSTIAAAGSGTPAAVFEGSSTTYTATVQNNSAASTGTFNSSVVFTNGTVTGVTCTTSGTNGASGGSGTPTATCTASALATGETLTITATVAATNTTTGADITATISVPALGISQAGTPVTVDELGLDSTGSTLAAGTAINVCTALVVADITDDAAAGAAQPGSAALIGQVSLSPLLTTADFQVTGPGVGSVTAATGCGALQSGVRFTPSTAGAYSVTALYNTGGTNVLSLTVGGGAPSNPVPTATNLAPSSANAGSGAFTLTVTGTGFVNGASVVRWNGVDLTTAFNSSTSLSASVPAANVLSAGSATVTVFTATPGGGTSNGLTFTINSAPNPVPSVSGLSPNAIGSGSAGFLMTVTGTNFVAGSVVRWNGADLATSFSSSTSLSATVPAANVASAGAANVTVFNPAPGGGASVTPQVFTITAGATKLAFTTQPGAGVAGSALDAQPVVAVQTAANATVTSDSTTVVTLTLNGAGTLTCTGGLSKTAAAGVATFAGCAVSAAGTGFTITASATSLTSATSATFDVSAAPPTSSTQLTVSNPANLPIPRSRLAFESSTGSLTATAVNFIIKRKADGLYWNATTAEWQSDLVLNVAVHGSGAVWSLAISGEDRRAFAETIVTLEMRATVGTTVYVNASIPELTIR